MDRWVQVILKWGGTSVYEGKRKEIAFFRVLFSRKPSCSSPTSSSSFFPSLITKGQPEKTKTKKTKKRRTERNGGNGERTRDEQTNEGTNERVRRSKRNRGMWVLHWLGTHQTHSCSYLSCHDEHKLTGKLPRSPSFFPSFLFLLSLLHTYYDFHREPLICTHSLSRTTKCFKDAKSSSTEAQHFI